MEESRWLKLSMVGYDGWIDKHLVFELRYVGLHSIGAFVALDLVGTWPQKRQTERFFWSYHNYNWCCCKLIISKITLFFCPNHPPLTSFACRNELWTSALRHGFLSCLWTLICPDNLPWTAEFEERSKHRRNRLQESVLLWWVVIWAWSVAEGYEVCLLIESWFIRSYGLLFAWSFADLCERLVILWEAIMIVHDVHKPTRDTPEYKHTYEFLYSLDKRGVLISKHCYLQQCSCQLSLKRLFVTISLSGTYPFRWWVSQFCELHYIR